LQQFAPSDGYSEVDCSNQAITLKTRSEGMSVTGYYVNNWRQGRGASLLHSFSQLNSADFNFKEEMGL
jgi:hypothetical protein